mmetsp:Transcript_99653/g.192472  ORF Transcript_99653/g.192472 Transcript_99653/m.192472 type:complete len:225 (-) Transcript_99653:160-834(-)
MEGDLDTGTKSTFAGCDLSGVLSLTFSASSPVGLSSVPFVAGASARGPFPAVGPALRPAEACRTNANCRASSETCVARSAACCISDRRQSRSKRNASSAASRASSASSQKTLASASRLTASATSSETAAGTFVRCSVTATSFGCGSCRTSCFSTTLASGMSGCAVGHLSASKRLNRCSRHATLRTSWPTSGVPLELHPSTSSGNWSRNSATEIGCVGCLHCGAW